MAVSARRAPGVSARSRENLVFILPLLGLLAWRLAARDWSAVTPWDLALDAAGMALLLGGLAIRVCARQWKAECCHDGLVTDGLYGWVRHPLYVGSFLLGTGICLVLADWVLFAAFAALFWISHGPVIRREEAELERVFGEAYTEYRRRVPALVPRALWPAGRFVPRRRREAVLRECDAVCIWPALPFLILLLEGAAQMHVDPTGVVGRAYVGVSLVALAFLVLVWLRLKPEYRDLIREERRRRFSSPESEIQLAEHAR